MPRRGATYQPRAAPWAQASALKGPNRHSTAIVPPLQGVNLFAFAYSQGVALG